MSSRHQPLNGADSPEGVRPYLVTLDERHDGDPRIRVRVPAAYGPKDAKHQAEFDHPDYVAVHAEEDATEYADVRNAEEAIA